MRPIKFRAWLPDNEYYQRSKTNKIYEVSSIGKVSVTLVVDGLCQSVLKERVILMQFIGLPDKQGKEIYEGDVVEVNEGGEISIHQVRWFGDYNYPAFDLDPDLDCECNGLQHIASGDDITMTVIGNIYNNPELLKEAK